MKNVKVLKADGTLETFQMQKLRNSLARAGATNEDIREITAETERQLYDGITTEVLYRRAFEMLRDRELGIAARYSLRRAMIGLGPTGFPFEDYLAELFRHNGYHAESRLQLPGRCVSHEIDVLAYTAKETAIVEAKFHMQPGTKSDVQVILYSYARFLDLKGTHPHKSKASRPIGKAYVATNTKFTLTAIKYAECVGIELLSWGYPRVNNLQDQIESSGLYPVTVLQSLSVRDKRELLSRGTVLCRDIIDNDRLLHSIGVSPKKISAVLDESSRLCAIA